MIGWLSGVVIERDVARHVVVINVGGVGYEVRVSLQTMASVGELGSALEMWIYTHVRAEQLSLFGFATLAEKQLFLLLLGVPKVGPMSALAVLGGFPLSELVRVLVRGDQRTLQKIPGIGRKTAEQVLLSLRDKAAAMMDVIDRDAADAEPTASAPVIDVAGAQRDEAQIVLVNLGWRQKQVESALAKVTESDAWIELAGAGEGATLDELVRRGLAQLMER